MCTRERNISRILVPDLARRARSHARAGHALAGLTLPLWWAYFTVHGGPGVGGREPRFPSDLRPGANNREIHEAHHVLSLQLNPLNRGAEHRNPVWSAGEDGVGLPRSQTSTLFGCHYSTLSNPTHCLSPRHWPWQPCPPFHLLSTYTRPPYPGATPSPPSSFHHLRAFSLPALIRASLHLLTTCAHPRCLRPYTSPIKMPRRL